MRQNNYESKDELTKYGYEKINLFYKSCYI